METINYYTGEYIKTKKSEAVATRKANYWRGFRACLFLVVFPLGLLFVAFCHAIINALN